MIFIWGSKGRTKTIGDGQFHCPDCQDHRTYAKKEVKRWFTLYFIPVFPMNTLGDFVECGACKSTYNSRVLDFDPTAARAKFEAAFSIAAKRVMFKMALADGEIDAAEIAQIAQAFRNITKREIEDGDIAAELEAARGDTSTVEDYLRDVAPTPNETGKELVLRSAIAVVKADGRIDAAERTEIAALIKALDMPRAYSNGVLAEEGLALS
jgi:tellurite resistance protein